MIAAYLSHPLSAPTREGIEENRRRAAKWAAWLFKQGYAVECSWIVMTGELEETPENRARGLECDKEQVRRCDLMVLGGSRVSSGMLEESSVAKIIVDFTHLGFDLPPENLTTGRGQVVSFGDLKKSFELRTRATAPTLPPPPGKTP